MDPAHCATDVEVKCVPVNVIVNPLDAAGIAVCDNDESVGTGFVTSNVVTDVVPPPGVGFVTVIFAVTALVMFPDGTTAVSRVEVTNVVVSAVPFQFTTEFKR